MLYERYEHNLNEMDARIQKDIDAMLLNIPQIQKPGKRVVFDVPFIPECSNTDFVLKGLEFEPHAGLAQLTAPNSLFEPQYLSLENKIKLMAILEKGEYEIVKYKAG